jgi:hypothetical protein
LFRGQTNYTWEINPSLFRHKDFDIAPKYEIVLFEYLLSGNHSAYTLSFDPIEHLILLQHFKVHTRLLDWTSDILVALFFACYGFDSTNNLYDGNLIMIQRNHYPTYKMNSNEKQMISSPPREKNQIEFFKERLNIDQVYILEPLIKNPRMRIQDGVFMFFPFLPLTSTEKVFITLHSFMRARNEVIRDRNKIHPDNEEQLVWIGNIVVDKNSKSSILEELDKEHGINFQNLFVENDFVRNQETSFETIRKQADTKLEWLLKQQNKSSIQEY